MTNQRVVNLPGNVPEPDQLYGRDDLIRHVWQQLEGNNILLMAPRRFGKTGVMRHVLRRPNPHYLPIHLDLMDVDSPAEFVGRLIQEVLRSEPLRRLIATARGIPRAVQQWAQGVLDSIEIEGAKATFKNAVGSDWRSTARKLMVELEKADPTLVFLLDELPAMLDRICENQGDGEARAFLAWFRTVRMQQGDQLRRHRFVVAGSIGIDSILRRLKTVDTLNDFSRVYVEPIGADQAVELIRDLAATYDIVLVAGAEELLLERIGLPVPYFVHLFFSQISQLPSARRSPLALDVIEEVYQQRILGPTCKHYFDHYRSRLQRYGVGGQRAALAILRAVSGATTGRVGAAALFEVYRKSRGRGASRDEFDELLADLQCDWYLDLDRGTNEYFFLVDLMGAWWRRWYRSEPRTARRVGTR